MALCIPQFGWVPGVTGAPNWVGGAGSSTSLDDPRWRGALRTSLDADSGQEKFVFRAVHDNATNKLYLSFWVKSDPSATPQNTEDVLWVGLQPAVAAAPIAFKLTYNNNAAVAADAGLTNTVFTYTGGSWSATGGAPPAWLQDVRVWKVTSVPLQWAFQIVIDVAGATLVNAANPVFKMFYLARVFIDALGMPTTRKWPATMPNLGSTSPAAVNPATPNHWEQYSIAGIGAAACTGGVRILDPYDSIGTTNADSHLIRISNPNTFYANVQNDMAQNVSVQVQFRLANWGSTSEWRNIGTPVPTPINTGAMGTLNSTWQPVPGQIVPGTVQDEVAFYTANWHQCIFAELQAAGGPAVNFTRAYAARNMDFTTMSQFRREAEISVRGLNDGFKLPQRDVYIYVERVNAPAKIDGQTQEQYARVRELWARLNDPSGEWTQEQRYVAILQRNYAHLAFIEDFDAAAQWAFDAVEKGHLIATEGIFYVIPNLPLVNRLLAELLRRIYDQIKPRLPELRENPLGWRQDPVLRNRVDSFLTNLIYIGPVSLPEPDQEVLGALVRIAPVFRYHVYRDSGDREQINGEWKPVLSAQPSFGYIAGFDHQVDSWELRLEGAQKVAENWYLISALTNGVKQVVTGIHAVQADERELIAPPERIVALPKYQPPGEVIADGDGCRVLIENLFKFIAGLLSRR